MHTDDHLHGRHVVTHLSRTTSSWVTISGDICLTRPSQTCCSTKHMLYAMYVYLIPTVAISITLYLRRMDRHAHSQPSFHRQAYPDSVTFSKIKSWPPRVALHGGQEAVIVEEQCGIDRPFRDAVKQPVDGPHASNHSFLHGLAHSTAYSSLRHNSP